MNPVLTFISNSFKRSFNTVSYLRLGLVIGRCLSGLPTVTLYEDLICKNGTLYLNLHKSLIYTRVSYGIVYLMTRMLGIRNAKKNYVQWRAILRYYIIFTHFHNAKLTPIFFNFLTKIPDGFRCFYTFM